MFVSLKHLSIAEGIVYYNITVCNGQLTKYLLIVSGMHKYEK